MVRENQKQFEPTELAGEDLAGVSGGYDKVVGWRQMRRAAETCGRCDDSDSTGTLRGSSGSW